MLVLVITMPPPQMVTRVPACPVPVEINANSIIEYAKVTHAGITVKIQFFCSDRINAFFLSLAYFRYLLGIE